jgi:phosphotransferase system enzyme I (PtsI)
VGYLYNPAAPSVVRLLDLVARAARCARIGLHVCGEMAADPYCVPLLLGLGFRSLSMSPPAIPTVKRLVRRASIEDCEALAARALEAVTAAEVDAAINATVERWS